MRRDELEKRAPGNASKLKVGVVAARFNEDITDALLASALKTLEEWSVLPKNVFVARVAGSFEVPSVAQRLIKKHKLAAVVALGCIIKGDTKHDEYLAHAVTEGLMRVSLDTGVPVGLGVLTVNNLAQAKARINYAAAAVQAALEAALV